jgi:hypothetical protein
VCNDLRHEKRASLSLHFPPRCKEYGGRDRCQILECADPCTSAGGRHPQSFRGSNCRLSHSVDACNVTADRRSPRSRRNRLRLNVDRHAGLLTAGITTLRVLRALLLIHEADNLPERPCEATVNRRPQVGSDLIWKGGEFNGSVYGSPLLTSLILDFWFRSPF